MSERVLDSLPHTMPVQLERLPTLDHVVDLPVLGVPTRFRTNSRSILDMVEEAFGAWRAAGPAPIDSGELPRVDVIVRDGAGGPYGDERAAVRHFCPDASRVIVSAPGGVGISDSLRRESVAYVTAGFVADREHFQTTMLEALTFSLLCHFDRHPLHAAAIAHGDSALLLAGGSGTGKSTLAYLAHWAGLDVLAEDHVWIQLAPHLRVWGGGGGRAGHVRLGSASLSHFPELASVSAGFEPDEHEQGKARIELRAGTRARLVADRAVVCLLARSPGAATLDRIGNDEIVSELERTVAPGFDRFPERHSEVVQALAGESGGWRLNLSTDPRQALPLIREMLQR